MLVVGFDPGLCTGVALFGQTTAKWTAGILQGQEDFYWQLIRSANLVVVEKPKIYPVSKARPNDIITLAVRAGELGGRAQGLGRAVRYVEPHEWKRTLPKHICHARIMALLTEAEKSQMHGVFALPDTKKHNAMDAIGIALWAVGRHVY
jgi:hypothetical protein